MSTVPEDGPRAVRVIDRMLQWAATAVVFATLSGLFLSLMLEVVVRYGTNAGLGWPNEMPALLFPWLTMWGAVLAAQYGRHIAVQVLVERLRSARTANEMAVIVGLKPIKGRSGPKIAY